MSRWKWSIILLGAMFVALAVPGCPPSPQLILTPLAVDFGATATSRTFRIMNAGGSALDWQVSEDIAWLSLVEKSSGKQASVLEGSTTTEIDVIEMTVDRTQVGEGTLNGVISVTSNGGDQSIAVAVSGSSSAQLQVSATAIDLGRTSTTAQFTITNAGAEALSWTLDVDDDAPWLTATPLEGELSTQGAVQTITVTADREDLPPGDFEGVLAFSSNGGDPEVTVSIEVPPLAVLPDSIAFGTLNAASSRLVTIQNLAFDDVEWTAAGSTTDGAAWLTIAPTGGTVAEQTSNQFTVAVDPTGLTPGDYTGQVLIESQNYTPAFSQVIPVSMSVSGFVINPDSLDFGSIEAQASNVFTITNTGTTAIDWDIDVPTAAAAWLSVSPTSGTLTASENITVTVKPEDVSPGSYEADLVVNHDDASETVTVTMARPMPPTLVVAPTSIDFMTALSEQTIAIWNPGQGTIGWSIDTTSFPAWLSLTPVDGAGVASGTVTGEETDLVTLNVDRDLAPTDQFDFEFNFEVTADSGSVRSVTVTVLMTVPVTPDIEVTAEDEDAQGVPFVNLDIGEDSTTFVIANTGNGSLFWKITGQEAAPWITSISPTQGTLEPYTQVTVTVSVDRTNLTYLGEQETLTIESNDPDQPALSFLVEVQVEKKISIGTRPGEMAFGVDVTADTLEIANMGDPDTILNFQVTSNKDWLQVYPDTGSSVGYEGTVKDWQALSVSVDRSLIEGNGASAKLLIAAYEVVDGQRVPKENVESVEVPVSVEAVELTIESTRSRIRIPSLVRTVLLMRNIRYQPIALPSALLGEVGNQFAVYEKGDALEVTESGQFLSGPEKIRANVLIILDYSGSMYAAAQQADEDEIADAADPLQTLYESCIPQLIDELPAQYRIGLGFMSERVGDIGGELDSLRLVGGDDGEPVFTANKEILKNRLYAQDIDDHGATTLLPVLRQATLTLFNEDAELGLIPFDDADMRAVISVTDGRLTTSSSFNILDTAQYMLDGKVRYMPIGWGSQVSGDPLIRISSATGGHYYATQSKPTGEVDAFGNALRIPLATSLQDWCITDPADECDQSVAKDLSSQMIFSYVTLKNEPSVDVEGRLTFNDPTDQDTSCVTEQGDISGSFAHTQLDFEGVVGDPRLGQISMRTDGIQADNTAVVTVRLEYAPRNMSELRFAFQVNSPDAYVVNVVKVAESVGGVLGDWTQSGTLGNLVFTSDDGSPMRYGEFGDMFELRFQNVTQPFVVLAAVTDPVIAASDPESKYFTIPDSITVTNEDYLAPAFPFPLLASTPAAQPQDDGSLLIELGSALSTAQIGIWNGGGSHEPTGVHLGWELSVEAGGSYFTPSAIAGSVVSTLTPDLLDLDVTRTLAPGLYEFSFFLYYNYGSVNVGGTTKLIRVTFEITDAVLTLSTQNFNFGAAAIELPISVTNSGQSELDWFIDYYALPSWLGFSQTSGTLGPGESDNFLVRVYRVNTPGAGDYATTFTVESDDGQSLTANVTMTVP